MRLVLTGLLVVWSLDAARGEPAGPLQPADAAAPSGAEGAGAPGGAEGGAEGVAEPIGLVAADDDDDAGLEAAATLAWANRYWSGGMVHGDGGVLTQPGVELALGLSGAVAPRFFAGAWASFHAGASAGVAAPELAAWHEADVFGGFTVAPAEGLDLSLKYTAFTSPAGAFTTVHELALVVAWDDTSVWQDVLDGRFVGLQPEVLTTFDLEHADVDSGAGLGMEVTLAPTFTVLRDGPIDLSLALPVTLGLGARDSAAGVAKPLTDFVHAGVALEAGLAFIAPEYGAWTVGLAGRVLALNQRMADANGDRKTLGLASLDIGATF